MEYFSALDGVIFAGVLLLSSLIGVFFAYKDRNRQSMDNYFFGERAISPIPVGLSLSVSFISAVTVIGFPVEIYIYGTVITWIIAGGICAFVFSAVYYVPLVHRLKIKTINEYLEMRYHRAVRSIVSVLIMLKTIFYMGIAIYLPSLALSTVTPLELSWTIALTSVVCTFYTSIGGMKAVIWTDVLQAVLMVLGSISVLAGLLLTIGWQNIVESVDRGERNNFLKFDMDPRLRATTWSVFVVYFIDWSNALSCSQAFSQRCLSCKSTRSSQISMLIAMFPTCFYLLCAISNGLGMYAYYEGCDPGLSGQISRPDEMVPRMALELFQSVPGMAGLFVSAACSGTLSTVSSGINSLSALLFLDFLLPLQPEMSQKNQLFVSKILSVVFGVVVTVITYMISIMKSNAVGIGAALTGMSSGAVLGIFTMGIFMPWVNCKGALAGVVCGGLASTWVSIASQFADKFEGADNKLPLSVEQCNITSQSPLFDHTHSNHIDLTSTFFPTNVTSSVLERPFLHETLYSISPFYIAFLGLLVSITVGNIVSFATGPIKTSEANPELFVPLVDNQVLPSAVRKFFRFGVPQRKQRPQEMEMSADVEAKVQTEKLM